MRALALSVLLCATASPATADQYWPGPDDIVAADASGLTLTSSDGTARAGMPFGSPFHSTMHTLVSVYGHEVTVGFPQECGEGPLVSVTIPGQISLMFNQDRLSGWMLINDATLRTTSGLGVGSPSAALAAEGSVEYFETGIGTEFSAGDLFGLMSEDRATLQAVWLGDSCIFR
jgi:hypothetical protein